MIIRTANFNPEFDKKLLCTCGHPDCDKRSVTQDVLDRVQWMRHDAQRPFIITSGGRCQYHYNEVDRNDTDHQNCVGVDIKCNTVLERNELMVLAGRFGATAVSPGDGFVHVAWRKLDVGDRRVKTWTYS